MDNVDNMAMLRQEPAEPSSPVEEAAKEWGQAQAYSEGKERWSPRAYTWQTAMSRNRKRVTTKLTRALRGAAE